MAGYMMSSIKRPAVSATKANSDQSSMPLEDALAILLQGKSEQGQLEDKEASLFNTYYQGQLYYSGQK